MNEQSKNSEHNYFDATDDENCKNCHYAHRTVQRDNKGMPIVGEYVYQCRRFPPTAMLMPTSPHSANLTSTFPIVGPEVVCAEFIPYGQGHELVDEPENN